MENGGCGAVGMAFDLQVHPSLDATIDRSGNEDRTDREQSGHEDNTNAEIKGGDPSHRGSPKLLR